MASKRDLKKRVQKMIHSVLDDCDYVMVSVGANSDAADKLIDEAVEFYEGVLSKINAAKSKKEFSSITEELNKAGEDFVKKLNAL
jgi:prefoldin subunit 5